MSPDLAPWRSILERYPLFAGLDASQQLTLRGLSEIFLHEKQLDLARGARLNARERLLLAAVACLPVLELGLDPYNAWQTVIVYPRTFVPRRSETDEAGVVHPLGPRVGEAWPHGPVLVSWRDLERDLAGDWDYGMNVVIHEMCHQLDHTNGGFDGMPKLPATITTSRWIRVFSEAFSTLEQAEKRGEETFLDPYALEAPAEFFAVACETFFVAPEDLKAGYPEVYELLKLYFRQDPWTRMHEGGRR
ncbi:MAG: zinc-dependent peptidase [Magnetococcales bacterium]|nr:zinc-dependent peptidase [Magnetococcales bacterium]